MDFYSGLVDGFITLTVAASVFHCMWGFIFIKLMSQAATAMVRIDDFLAVFLCRASSAMRQANVAGCAATLIGFMFPQLRFDTSRFGLVLIQLGWGENLKSSLGTIKCNDRIQINRRFCLFKSVWLRLMLPARPDSEIHHPLLSDIHLHLHVRVDQCLINDRIP